MLITDTLKHRQTNNTPIWVMRQAGRYLPEYRNVRNSADDFISFCLSPEKACEVTLQPIRRYDFDAAIIFSDILLVPHAMGRNVTFIPGTGPKLNPLDKEKDFSFILDEAFEKLLFPVGQAVKKTRAGLPEKTALIGFSGAPWTLMSYLTEGGSSRDFAVARDWLWANPQKSEKLLTILAEMIVRFLKIQADSGVDILMLFDSWAGAVPAVLRQKVIIKMHQKIISDLRAMKINLPIISFPKGLGEGLAAYADEVDIQGLGLDHYTDRNWAVQSIRKDIVLQGNLDPLCLVSGGNQLKKEVDSILYDFRDRAHIFNLGHGIVPQTPPEHVARLIELVRG